MCNDYNGLYALSLFRGGYSTDGLKDLVEMNEVALVLVRPKLIHDLPDVVHAHQVRKSVRPS